MELYLLRHAIAEERSASGDDAHRVLTPAGITQATHSAMAMQALNIRLHTIATSPFYRTRQTADIIAHSYQLQPVVDERLAPGFDVHVVNHIVQQIPTHNILIVGHEPDLSWVIWSLVNKRVNVQRAGLFRLDRTAQGWTFVYELDPPAQVALIKYS